MPRYASVAELPWTNYFPDARLQGLIRQALDNNRDLRVAMLTIEQLRAATYQSPECRSLPHAEWERQRLAGPVVDAPPYP
jgi:outer membrane protein TolC